MDVPAYRVQRILMGCPGLMKIKQSNPSKESIFPNALHDEVELSSDGKKRQVIDQLVSEAIVQLTKPGLKRKEQNIVAGILHNIFLDDVKRKPYATRV